MNKPEVFLSYAWGGESEAIVNELENAFAQKGIVLTRDKRDLGFKGMITDFMQQIGKGNAVITVISDKYLKSPYCMFELLEIYRNRNFQRRIFPIVMQDASIFDPIPRLQYLTFWKDKIKEFDTAFRENGWDAINVIGNDYKVYETIFRQYGVVVNVLKDINALTPGMHRADNFQTVIDAVKALLDEDAENDDTGVAPVDLEFIVETLAKQKCILFLGPELFRTPDNSKSRQQQFFETLARRSIGKILSFNQNGFFVFSNDQAKKRLLMQIVDFYEELADNDLIQKIAEIPFKTIVSVNPDILLKTFFDDHKYPCNFEFFDKKQVKDIQENPSITKPLIYNLCGSITNQNTLILTHDDLFEYFKALMGNNTLPQELRKQLETAEDYIFLGCQFDKWYMQLILSLLNLQDEKYNFIRYACKNAMSEETESLCINHFKIEFIGPDNNAFINKLHQQCADAGILRNFSVAAKTYATIDNPKIQKQYDMIYEYEKKLQTEKDPNLIQQYEEAIETIKAEILQQEKAII